MPPPPTYPEQLLLVLPEDVDHQQEQVVVVYPVQEEERVASRGDGGGGQKGLRDPVSTPNCQRVPAFGHTNLPRSYETAPTDRAFSVVAPRFQKEPPEIHCLA